MDSADPRDLARVERRIRNAGLAALDDVVPVPLRDRVRAEVAGTSAAPGVLALVVGGGAGGAEGVSQPAAGVQLIYDGLRLTRQVVAADPWNDGTPEAGDLAVLAADVLVARGFYLVANAPAADRAVDVVREFGRDQSTDGARSTGVGNLERSILRLALEMGRSLNEGQADPADREDLVGRTVEQFPPGAGPGFPPTRTVLEAIGDAGAGTVDPEAFHVAAAPRSSVPE